MSIISCKILGGKEPAAIIKDSVKQSLNHVKNKYKLAVIMVGDNPASRAYVNGKKRDCEECGIDFELIHFSENVNQETLEQAVEELNLRREIRGILVQLPLPKHLNKEAIIDSISPNKDVDCFCEVNLGRLFLNRPVFEPCTPRGILDLCQYYDINLKGANCVVIGRSDIVGKPLATMLINNGATVTVCNSLTKDLKSFTSNADIIICAVGKPKFLTADMVKEGVVVIDVGINKDESNNLCGDADFESIKEIAGAITPVPGGVGLMTRATLMKNLVKAVIR